MEPLPSVDQAYNLVQREETRSQVLQPRNTNNGVAANGVGAGLAVRGWQNQPNSWAPSGSRGGGGGVTGCNWQNDDEDKSKLVCSHCKKKKHTKESCFELVGYPDWWIEKYGKPPSAIPPARATPWNRGGHAAADIGEQDRAGDGGRFVATEGNREAAQYRGNDGGGTHGVFPPANQTGAANFAGGTVVSQIGQRRN